MSAPKYAKQVDASQKPIVEYLRGVGCTVALIGNPLDALVGYRGGTYLVEFKTEGTYYGRKLKASQKEYAEVWQGSEIVVLKSVNDAIEWINSLPQNPINAKRISTNNEAAECSTTLTASHHTPLVEGAIND